MTVWVTQVLCLIAFTVCIICTLSIVCYVILLHVSLNWCECVGGGCMCVWTCLPAHLCVPVCSHPW